MNKTPRILIIRTDRMGDLILSTPVIRALREAFPVGYLGMMISPAYRELIEGHPDLNTVILYDKDREQKGWWKTVQFALKLKGHRFDTALILHSTNRVILVSLLAGIPRRVGYARRMAWALTDSIPYLKPEGTRHELEYNLDLLRKIGIQATKTDLSVSINPSYKEKIDQFLHNNGLNGNYLVLALHPGGSCPSKRWPAVHFAALADLLVERYGAKVIVVTGPEEKFQGEAVIRQMRYPAIPAFGIFTVGELAALLKSVRCLISNDSGPVHLACAVGTPVVSIFGRWGGGLSPTRWGPTGANSLALHHDIGCRPCLAHRCTIGFACLEAVSVEELLAAVEYVAELKTGRG